MICESERVGEREEGRGGEGETEELLNRLVPYRIAYCLLPIEKNGYVIPGSLLI